MTMVPAYAGDGFATSTTITVRVLPCVITDFSITSGTPIPTTTYVIEGAKIEESILAFVQTPACQYTQTYSMTNVNGGSVPSFISESDGKISYYSDQYTELGTYNI